jgi:hypothetical protein
MAHAMGFRSLAAPRLVDIVIHASPYHAEGVLSRLAEARSNDRTKTPARGTSDLAKRSVLEMEVHNSHRQRRKE